MKCYNHKDVDASSICLSCGRALCAECLKENNNVIICKDSDFCLERANLVQEAHDNNKKILPMNNKILKFGKSQSIPVAVLGLMFIIFAITQFRIMRLFSFGFLFLGLTFLFTSYNTFKAYK